MLEGVKQPVHQIAIQVQQQMSLLARISLDHVSVTMAIPIPNSPPTPIPTKSAELIIASSLLRNK